MANRGKQTGRSLKGGVGRYQTKSGETRWRYVLRHNYRLHQKAGFLTQKEAKEARDRRRNELNNRTYVNETRDTFGTYAETWIDEAPELRDSTRAMYRDTLSRNLRDFHQRKLVDITPEEVSAWHARLRRRQANTQTGTLSDASVDRAYSLLRRVFSVAVKRRKLSFNPCVLERRGRTKLRETPLFTDQEVLQLTEEMPEEYRALILVAAFGGLRWSEAIALRPIDLDLEAGTVSVRRTYVEQSDGKIQQSDTTKTDAGRRTVPLLSPLAVAALRAHIRKQDTEPTHLLFSSGRNTALRRANFYRRTWTPALKAAGLTRERYTFHHLRHYALTSLGQSGATLQELMDWGGHSSVKSVMVYQHTGQRHLEDVVRNAAARIHEATGVTPIRRTTAS